MPLNNLLKLRYNQIKKAHSQDYSLAMSGPNQLTSQMNFRPQQVSFGLKQSA